MSHRLLHPKSHPLDRKVPPNIQLLRHNPEIVEIARIIFERAQEVLHRIQPPIHARYGHNGLGPFSAKQYVFTWNNNRYEIQQSGLMISGEQEHWDRTRVTSLVDKNRWSLLATHHSDPASLLLTKNRQLNVPVDDARIVMNDMTCALESWLTSRNANDFITRQVLPVQDRLHAFLQRFLHRVSPPKD